VRRPWDILFSLRWNEAEESGKRSRSVASYKKASRGASARSRESFFCSPYRYVRRPGGDLPSLAEGTSYLRIVFASADYCLTCSVALSCLRGSASGPALLVFRRVSFASRAVYTSYIHTHIYIECVCVWGLTFKHTHARTRCTMSFWYSFARSLSILANVHARNQTEHWPSNENLIKLMFRKCVPPIIIHC